MWSLQAESKDWSWRSTPDLVLRFDEFERASNFHSAPFICFPLHMFSVFSICLQCLALPLYCLRCSFGHGQVSVTLFLFLFKQSLILYVNVWIPSLLCILGSRRSDYLCWILSCTSLCFNKVLLWVCLYLCIWVFECCVGWDLVNFSVVFLIFLSNINKSLFLSGWALERGMERGVLQELYSPVDQNIFRSEALFTLLWYAHFYFWS